MSAKKSKADKQGEAAVRQEDNADVQAPPEEADEADQLAAAGQSGVTDDLTEEEAPETQVEDPQRQAQEEARDRLNRQVLAQPNNPQLVARLALANLDLGHNEEALDGAIRLTELAPNAARGYRLRARAQTAMERHDAAAHSWERYLAINPALEDVIHLSKSYRLAGLDGLPLTTLAARLGNGRASNANPAVLGLLLSYLERGDEAEAYVLGVMNNPPRTARFAAAAAWILAKRGRYNLARRMTEWAISMRPVLNPERGQTGRPHVLIVTSIPRNGCITGEIFLWNNFYGGPNFPTFMKPSHVNLYYQFNLKLSYALLEAPNIANALTGRERPDVVLGNFSPEVAESAVPAFEKLVAQLGVEGLNGPEPTRAARRDLNWQRFRDETDFVFPKTIRVRHPGDNPAPVLEEIRENFEFPVILRPTDTHWGKGAVKCENEDDVREYLGKYRLNELLIIQFHEYRKDWDDRYVTYRCANVQGELVPITMFRNRTWKIQGEDDDTGSLRFRHEVLAKDERHREEEDRFMNNMEETLGAEAVAALKRAFKITKLDIAGVDFSFLPDGRVIIFEVNPNMLLTFQRGRRPEWSYFKDRDIANLQAIERALTNAAGRSRAAQEAVQGEAAQGTEVA